MTSSFLERCHLRGVHLERLFPQSRSPVAAPVLSEHPGIQGLQNRQKPKALSRKRVVSSYQSAPQRITWDPKRRDPKDRTLLQSFQHIAVVQVVAGLVATSQIGIGSRQFSDKRKRAREGLAPHTYTRSVAAAVPVFLLLKHFCARKPVVFAWEGTKLKVTG